MKITVIAHIYNEEYLLPFWLEHHKKIFDHGIIINYNSTDKSMEIVRSICPTWQIIESRNNTFEPIGIDAEVMDIERSILGYKMALNVTEFLMITNDLHNLLSNTGQNNYPVFTVTALSEKNDYYPNSLKELYNNFERINTNFRCPNKDVFRFLHSYETGKYHAGRHACDNPLSESLPIIIIWFGCYPWNVDLIKRKLQIDTRVPDSDTGYVRWNKDKFEKFKNDLLTSNSISISENELLLHSIKFMSDF
jgi:hypothetical protein